jgi:hypothetical protein
MVWATLGPARGVTTNSSFAVERGWGSRHRPESTPCSLPGLAVRMAFVGMRRCSPEFIPYVRRDPPRPSCPGSVRHRSCHPATPSGPASAPWRRRRRGQRIDELSHVSAHGSVCAVHGCDRRRLSAALGRGSGCPLDRGRRSPLPRTAARPAPGRPRRRWPAAARRCRRGRRWPG